jgi:hypothetical protein
MPQEQGTFYKIVPGGGKLIAPIKHALNRDLCYGFEWLRLGDTNQIFQKPRKLIVPEKIYLTQEIHSPFSASQKHSHMQDLNLVMPFVNCQV